MPRTQRQRTHGQQGDYPAHWPELALLREASIPVHHLGLTQQGEPRHPLYLRRELQPELLEGTCTE